MLAEGDRVDVVKRQVSKRWMTIRPTELEGYEVFMLLLIFNNCSVLYVLGGRYNKLELLSCSYLARPL